MYLKRLEISGFKSFADPIILSFEQGICGVVGPNGSGKSNIVDAIKWSLGEQSAKSLRGDKMEDVLFSGSFDRPPMRKATVELVFENGNRTLPSHHDEVKVGRVLRKDKGSDYLLHGEAVRLSDIKKFLMDTGIGKDGYSVISQGNVQTLLENDKQRRIVLEEAAGISKYKYDRDIAQGKVSRTREDMTRMSDILKEIESRLPGLENQAEKAKIHIESKEKLTNFRLEIYHHELFQSIQQLKDIEGKKVEINHDLVKHQSEIQELVKILEKMRAQESEGERKVRELRETLEEKQAGLARLMELKKDLELQKVRLKTRIEEREKTLVLQAKNREKALKDSHTLEDQIALNQQELIRLEGEKLNLDQSLGEIELRFTHSEGQTDEGQSELFDKFQKLSYWQNNCDNLKKHRDTLTLQIQKTHSEYTHLKNDLDKIQFELTQETKLLLEQREKAQNLLAQSDKMEKEIEKLSSEKENVDYDLRLTTSDIKTIRGKIDLLSTMGGGSDQGSREVLKFKEIDPNRYGGIFGTVGQLLQVPTQYSLAFENILGGSINNVVVNSSDLAREIIAELKKYKLGRANLAPLDLIHVPRRVLFEGHPNGLIGRAIELVQFDPKFFNVMEMLLANTLVFNDLDGAVAFKKIFSGNLKLASLEGDIIVPSGVMSGGFRNQRANSLFTQKAEIEKLQAELKKFEKESQILQKEKGEIDQTLSELKPQFLQVQRDSQELNYRLIGWQKELEGKTGSNQKMVRELEALRLNINDLQNQVEETDRKITEETDRIVEAKKSLESKQAGLENWKSEHKEFLKDKEKLQGEIRVLSTTMAVLQERVGKLRSDHQTLQENALHLGEEIEVERSKQEKSHKTRIQLEEDESRVNLEKGSLDSEITQIKTKIQELSSEYSTERNQTADLELSLAKHKSECEGLQKFLSDQELRRARLEVQLNSTRDRMIEEFGIELPEDSEQYDFSFSSGLTYQDLQKEVKSLQKILDELGPVNILAIEELEKTRERSQFIQTQLNDLDSALQTLGDTISELNSVCEQKLKHTFAEVKIHFAALFKNLFNGGEARLEWKTPEAILESGIEIFCYPPGKKEKNLSLLSGGEKTLVTLSFLFAIIRIRPPAFCILDEADAALDDANVIRFTKMIKNFNKSERFTPVQFIVVTHKHETMKEMDRLYGVTMEQMGVSRLVTVELEKFVEKLTSELKEDKEIENSPHRVETNQKKDSREKQVAG